MKCGAALYCAHDASARYSNSQVTVDQMATDYGIASNRGWTNSDLVFFYGHNTQIQPQWFDSIELWRPPFIQPTYVADWRPWGTISEPYEYHYYSPITDASLANSYVIIYGYNALTSILIGNGKDFQVAGNWYTENSYNGPSTLRTNHFGGETEWIIANGCNAVTVATPENVATPLAVNAWKYAWGRLHMVMGHYHETDVGSLPNLVDYAADLKGGAPVKVAYFDSHTCPYWGAGTYCRPSAIEVDYVQLCYPNPCTPRYFNTDTWTDNDMADVTSSYLSVRYRTDWDVTVP